MALTSLTITTSKTFDFKLNNVQIGNVTGAVPEPATWAMMMLGFGGMGFSLRRRKTAGRRIRFA